MYARETYNFFQNWLANAVLKNETGMWDASIASLLIPGKSEPIVFDKYEEV